MSGSKQSKRSRSKSIQKMGSCWVRDKYTHRLLFIPGHKNKSVQSDNPSEIPSEKGD